METRTTNDNKKRNEVVTNLSAEICLHIKSFSILCYDCRLGGCKKKKKKVKVKVTAEIKHDCTFQASQILKFVS